MGEALTNEEIRDIAARKIRLRCAVVGEGPPLLLLHGFLMNRHAWDDVIPVFAQHFTVIAPDLPGFGESEKPPPTRFAYTVEAFSECVADLIAALRLGRMHVIGQGFASAVALTVAADYSEFVDRLVLVGPHVYTAAKSARVFDWPILGTFLFKQLYGRSVLRSYYRENVFSPGFPLPTARIDSFYDDFNAPSARESAFATMQAMQDTRSTVARIGRVKAPTFVVWGASDKLYPPQLGQRLARELSAERLQVMNTGHAPAMEDPLAFTSTVLPFLRKGKQS